jgi:hypothetical protein
MHPHQIKRNNVMDGGTDGELEHTSEDTPQFHVALVKRSTWRQENGYGAITAERGVELTLQTPTTFQQTRHHIKDHTQHKWPGNKGGRSALVVIKVVEEYLPTTQALLRYHHRWRNKTLAPSVEEGCFVQEASYIPTRSAGCPLCV